ncbi:MAG TPA: hypothetical protein PKI71_13315, partial [Candidatus Rifleibacterium sp.]|nr:hypothetical protein [Candidatus Rifleibacterium sp.]
RRKLYVAFTRAEDLLLVTGRQIHSLPPEDETKPTEPLHDVCEIISQNPELGKILPLPEWREIIDAWLLGGHEPPVEKKLPEMPVPEPAELEKDLRAVAGFI